MCDVNEPNLTLSNQVSLTEIKDFFYKTHLGLQGLPSNLKLLFSSDKIICF